MRGSFQMRRKQLANTLEDSLGIGKAEAERLCRAAGVDPRRRGETLTLDEFAKLAREAGAQPKDRSAPPATTEGPNP